MPLPMWAAAAGLSALQNPDVQNAALNVGGGLLRGGGRVADYLGRGTANLAQNAGTGLANRLGALGEQYLPESVNTVGGYGRQGLGYLSGGLGGLYNAALGTQQQPQMGGMQPQQNMQGMGGMQPMMGMAGMGGQMQMSPQQMMQQYYQNNIQQDQIGGQQQQLIDQYNRELVPGLAARFGGTRNSGFQGLAARGGQDLQRDLAALGEQSRMQRLGQIAPYLQGQQQLGLQAQELGQRGTIEQRENALRQLGAMGGYGQQQQQNQVDQLIRMINARGNLGNLAAGGQFQNLQVGGQAPWWQPLLAGAANAVGQGIQGGIGGAIGGPQGALAAGRR